MHGEKDNSMHPCKVSRDTPTSALAYSACFVLKLLPAVFKN